MKRSIKEVFIRVVILMVGLTIAHLGVTLFLLAEGADPFNVFVQGIFRTLQPGLSNVSFIKGIENTLGINIITHGNTHVVISCIIILILLFVDKSYIKIGTILCMICGGPIIDAFSIVLNPVFAAFPVFWFRILMMIAGCVILAFGMTIVIKSDAGTGPNDLVALVISEKLKKKFSIIRIIVDFSFVIIGLLLGADLGIGTFICAFIVGPVAGIFLPFNEKAINKILLRII